jgi:uncharacterized protein
MNKIIFFLLTFICFQSLAQVTPSVDSILMRDGKKLAADIYVPDTSLGQHYPTILVQTPYNRLFYRLQLPLGLGTNFANGHYAMVIIDWRCFYGSASACIAQPKRGEDGYDVVEWIAAQPWSDGKVGTWGASALGKIQFQTAKENPPHLICSVPLVAGSQMDYDEYYEGGDYRTEYVQQLDALGFGLSAFVLANQVHNTIWQFVENANYYPASINVPMLMIGGWYDHNTRVILDLFNGLRSSSPVAVRDKHRLLMGPWAHGGFGTTQVGTGQQGQLFYPCAAGWSDSLALLFLDYYLRNISNGWNSTPYIQYFQMGENTWQNTAAWPPTGLTNYNLYFHKNGLLDNVVPGNSTDTSMIVYDPHNPSPTVGGSTLKPGLGQGPYDQDSLVESRNDILKFTSVVLGSNVVMKGKAIAHLRVSSDMRDTDFGIRITDVYPDGRSMILTDGIKRLRFRNGYAAVDTSMASSDSIYSVAIEFPDVCNTFLAGHRIRVDVTSSNYPRFDCNLNNGGAMYVAGDTLTAHNTVFLNNTNTSYIELPLVDFSGSITEVNPEPIKLNVFPNPVNSNEFSIEINSQQNNSCKIELFDILGNRISVKYSINLKEGKNVVQSNASNLSNGLYIILLTDSSGKKSFAKFSIAR